MKHIEAFDLLTESIERYVSKALTDGSRGNVIYIGAPIDPLSLQQLYSEFKQLPKDDPSCDLLFERTSSILNNWSAFIALKKNDESLSYRIDECYRVWRKQTATDNKDFFNGIDPYVFTWDKFLLAINEVNVYLRRKIGVETTSGNIKIKIAGKTRDIWVSDVDNCKGYKCFHPHDCPIQGARGVRSSQERWMCLTNLYHGCPDEPQKK